MKLGDVSVTRDFIYISDVVDALGDIDILGPRAVNN